MSLPQLASKREENFRKELISPFAGCKPAEMVEGLPDGKMRWKDNAATFTFWRSYSDTLDRAQRGLSVLTRTYLTLPLPTSTGSSNYMTLSLRVHV